MVYMAIFNPLRVKLRPRQTPRRAALRRAALRGAAKFSKPGPTNSGAACENPVYWDSDYAWRVFFCDT